MGSDPPFRDLLQSRKAHLFCSEDGVAEYVEPLGLRILIRKDEARHQTRGGIVLPDSSEIPTITGRVVEISVQVERSEDFPIRKYDKVLFHPKNAIPVDFESDNLLFVVPVEDVVAVFRRPRPDRAKSDPSASTKDPDPEDSDDRTDEDDVI
jgi:chaperonin GroES